MAAETFPHHHAVAWSNQPPKLRVLPRTTPSKKASNFPGADPWIFDGIWHSPSQRHGRLIPGESSCQHGGIHPTPPPKTLAHLRRSPDTSAVALASDPTKSGGAKLSIGAKRWVRDFVISPFLLQPRLSINIFASRLSLRPMVTTIESRQRRRQRPRGREGKKGIYVSIYSLTVPLTIWSSRRSQQEAGRGRAGGGRQQSRDEAE